MKFKHWFYLTKLSLIIVFPMFVVGMLAEPGSVVSCFRLVATAILVPLCLCGAYFGLRLARGKLQMSCPFCGQSGQVGGNNNVGLWMECQACGIIHGTGIFRLKLTKTSPEDILEAADQ